MTRVLVVDDSALLRSLLSDVLSEASDLEVVGTARDGVQALERIESLAPDVITLDVEMPRMNGLAFLEKLMTTRPTPVVMVSSLTGEGTDSTLRALELGAIDFVLKPTLGIRDGIHELSEQIVAKVRIAATARVTRAARVGAVRGASSAAPTRPTAPTPPASPASAAPRSILDPVAIGASTGGTRALQEILTKLPARAPGLVIVQHMPAGFTASFAKRLDELCRIGVKEAEDGDLVEPGLALIAPGGRQMRIERAGTRSRVLVTNEAPFNRHAPSVDILFHSCVQSLGARATGVLLTGMGADGARGLADMRLAGARTIVQDEASCIVYGMPRAAVELGAAQLVLPLDQIASALMEVKA